MTIIIFEPINYSFPSFWLQLHLALSLSIFSFSLKVSQYSGVSSNIILWLYFRFKLKTHPVLYNTLSSSSTSYIISQFFIIHNQSVLYHTLSASSLLYIISQFFIIPYQPVLYNTLSVSSL